MSQLEEDIKKLGNEAFTKGDAWAAVKIVGEVAGFVTVMGIATAVVTTIFNPLLAVGGGAMACRFMLKKCADVYMDLPTDQRRLVAKLCKAIHGVID
ncbi:MAG: hypothetical protein NC548_39965 [Lachnospiraceae bacterium]|nr:hypothetical protein [Lachnospiraceae bacterium]